jgi:predicted DNA-binding ribbon-helix-helix protein
MEGQVLFPETSDKRRPEESHMVLRNVRVRGRRTSLRLEQPMWDALEEIAVRERRSINDICSTIDERRCDSGLTGAVRVYIMSYFRAAATEMGHVGVGHGRLLESRRAG